MGMGFAPTWLRQVSPPLLHKTTLTTAWRPFYRKQLHWFFREGYFRFILFPCKNLLLQFRTYRSDTFQIGLSDESFRFPSLFQCRIYDCGVIALTSFLCDFHAARRRWPRCRCKTYSTLWLYVNSAYTQPRTRKAFGFRQYMPDVNSC